MKKHFKILAVILSIIMLLSALPAQILSAGDEPQIIFGPYTRVCIGSARNNSF